MSEFVTSLDQALDRLRQGEAPAAILADYPAQNEFLAELLPAAVTIDTLRPAPLPPAADLAADREQFLAELTQLAPPAVSAGLLMRLKKWITQHPLRSLIQTSLDKEQRRMNGVLVKTMLILTLVFGAGSGAAIASAHSLPGEPLYPLKIGLEEARLALTSDPVQQASQWQERVRERTAEIARMALNGQIIGEAELARLQNQTQTCLQQTANLPEPAMVQQLEQFQQMAQQQQQLLEQTGGYQVQAALQTMTQARQAAQDGLADPVTFRYRYGQHRPDEAPPQPTPTPSSGRQVTPTATTEPNLAPMPSEVASPAVEPTLAPTATPVRPRHTPQPTGDANHYGPQPVQPGPGQPGGNPEGQNTPTGDANHYGPQPVQPGPGQPGGNPEATCTPTGDANRDGSPSATPQPGGNSGDSGGSDNSGGSGGSGDSGGGSGDTGGSGGSDNSGGSGGSSDSGGDSGDSGGSDNSGGSGGSSDSGGSDSGSSGSDSGGSGGSGGGHK